MGRVNDVCCFADQGATTLQPAVARQRTAASRSCRERVAREERRLAELKPTGPRPFAEVGSSSGRFWLFIDRSPDRHRVVLNGTSVDVRR
ncbi:MAG TPA: hypothetical protein VMY37_25315 [Thermoguttaceae bacterium]|nr:hypothetical protein [Thermoguttaceae bacterium]